VPGRYSCFFFSTSGGPGELPPAVRIDIQAERCQGYLKCNGGNKPGTILMFIFGFQKAAKKVPAEKKNLHAHTHNHQPLHSVVTGRKEATQRKRCRSSNVPQKSTCHSSTRSQKMASDASRKPLTWGTVVPPTAQQVNQIQHAPLGRKLQGCGDAASCPPLPCRRSQIADVYGEDQSPLSLHRVRRSVRNGERAAL